jgi:hypothetical protein
MLLGTAKQRHAAAATAVVTVQSSRLSDLLSAPAMPPAMGGAASMIGPSFVSTQHQIFRPTRIIQAQALSADARRMRHHPMPCLPIRPGLQRLGSCSSGSLSPASRLDAGMPSTHGSCGTHDRQRFPKFTSMRRLHPYWHSNPCQRSRAFS